MLKNNIHTKEGATVALVDNYLVAIDKTGIEICSFYVSATKNI